MKRILTSLVFLLPVLLWMGATAQPEPLPDDARFDQPVKFQTGSDGESLSAMMAALARSVNLTPIVDDVPDRAITYDIGDPKPFRQVWQLVLSLNDLDYELLENDVVVIGTSASLERVRGEASADEAEADAAEAEARVEQRYYDVNNEPSQVVELLDRTVDGIEAQTLPANEDTVVVDATADQHEQVQRVLDRFDTVDEGPETERRLYRVDTDPVGVTEQLTEAIDDVDVQRLSEDRPNTLVVNATPDQHERVETLIADIEAAARPDIEQRYYDVNSEPSRVVELLNRTVDDVEVQTLPGNDDTVVVDATPDRHDQVRRVLDRFDTAEEGPDTERRLYRVDTDPADVTEHLTRSIDGLDVQPLSEDRLNTLVVNATPDQHTRVEALIAEVEAATAPDVEQRYYQVNRAPSEIVELLGRTVDEVEVQAVPGSDDTVVVDATPDRHDQVRRVLDRFDTVEEGEATERRFYRVNNDPGDVVQLLRQAIEDVDVEALAGDMQTIVVNATPDRHAQVESVLAEFDTRAERTPLEQRVYSLSNASAEELAGVLDDTDIVVEGDTTDGEGAGEGTDEEGGPREFTVVPDPRTNSLIITATPPVQERIAELIPELDAPQRQVNVQVRIQEINRRVAHNLGIDMSAGFGNLSANLLGGGLDLIFDPQSVITSLNLGATLDALESQGLSRRVDDTNLTVLNNETGRMQSGGRIELTFPSSDGEISTRTIEFGVIVEVTPRVASDGRVIMDVTAEVSDVLVPLNEGGIPERIDFSEREVSSTVTLQQGQTVLLGGLLQNSFSQTESRLPILGDIPVLGALFGSTEVEDENTELLLVVNAQLVD